jgi:hypothetical protein
MRRRLVRVAFAAVVTFSTCNAFAAPFANLDFEQATIVPADPDGAYIDAAAAFPGWTSRVGTAQRLTVLHNLSGGGAGELALFDEPSFTLGIPLLEGQYMAVLIAGTNQLTASLTQTGDIPLSAQSIRFLTDGHRGPPVLTINGTVLPLTLISNTGGIFQTAEYAAPVTVFAGTTVDMRFDSGLNITAVDRIVFSSDPVPEASAVAGIGVGWTLQLAGAARSRTQKR